MKVGVFYNESNAQSVRAARKLKRLLTENKIDFVDMEEGGEKVKTAGMDLIVVFGGDGSVLKAAKIALDKVPLAAVNTGNLGFLTGFERDDIEMLVKSIKSKSLDFSRRKMLEIKHGDETFYALNDAVVMKNYQSGADSCCVKLTVTVDEHLAAKFPADGVIFSTPTGSTAYALSAGGPIVSPDVQAVIMAPICSHSLTTRPMIFSQKATIRLDVNADSEDCALFIDGKFVAPLSASDSVSVASSDKSIRISEGGGHFLDKLNEKIAGWSAIKEEGKE